GPRWGAIAGWLFLAQVPSGTAFVGLLAASYLAAPFSLGRDAHFLIAAGIVAGAYALNLVGLRLVGTAQAIATGGVLALVGIVVLGSAPAVRGEAFAPFAPSGWSAVGLAAVQLFWAFVGWEAITPLAADFRNPRDISRASLLAVVVVGILYVSLAIATIGTRAYGRALGSETPLVPMAASTFGPAA